MFTLIERRANEATASAAPSDVSFEVDRRAALAFLATGAAAALASCSPPRETATPYVHAPEGGAAGTRRRYATTLTLAGYGRGVTGVCIDGRPIKIDGSAKHPASLGSTDVFAEAALLDLYDPNRLKTPLGPSGVTDWTSLGEMLGTQMTGCAKDQGRSLALVTGRITSPSQLRQIDRLKAAYPEMRWTRFEAVHDDNARAALTKAYGRSMTLLPRYAEADAVLWLGADPLGPGPSQIAAARAIVSRRRPNGADAGRLSRLYAAEATMSQSGALADHRLPADLQTQHAILTVLARSLGATVPPPTLPIPAARFADAIAKDFANRHGRALVEVGRAHLPETHALALWVNERLGAPIYVRDDIDPHPESHAASLAGLEAALQSGTVKTLILLDCNPAFHAPALAKAIQAAPFSLHLSAALNETAALCRWRAPMSHSLESWSDSRAPDGTASLGQPLIRPLYASKSPLELLAMLAGDAAPDEQALVRQTWPDAEPESGDAWWRASLASGVATAKADSSKTNASLKTALPPLAPPVPTSVPKRTLILEFIPHPTLWDGRFADNAWLQECPDPITKEAWGSALRLSTADAHRLKLADGDRVRLHAGGSSVEAQVKVVMGQAEGVCTLPLGGGRSVAGPIGRGVGVNAAALRGPNLAWTVAIDRVERIGSTTPPISIASFKLDAETSTLAPTLTATGLAKHAKAPKPAPPPSLLPAPQRGDHAWAMVIDTAACIGCNACVTSCQSENNIPSVGPEEVAAGRDMHWLRIDRYDPGPVAEDPQPVFTPIPCMQCEQAPCEPVCPVEASVHDHEGLNDQVYNRCVGTRFCQANCPYKVRRFNYRDYASGRLYPDLDAEPLKAQRNPDVTVRARGVMEKCTYCVQRIAGAKSESERAGAPIADGSLKTACQSACPTQAITFGDLNDPAARVNALRTDPRHFALLEELGTRPRTTYLAKVRNSNPALEGGA